MRTERSREAQLRADQAERGRGGGARARGRAGGAAARRDARGTRAVPTGDVLRGGHAGDRAAMRRGPRAHGALRADETVTAVAAWSRSGEAHLAVGTRFALEGASVAAQVREKRPAGTRRQLRRRVRPDRARGSGGRDPILGRLPDRRRGTDLGAGSQRPRPARRRFRPIRSRESPISPSWPPRQSQTRRPARSSAEWPTSRRRSGVWPRSSLRAAPPQAVFAAVAEEVGKLLSAGATGLSRFDFGRHVHGHGLVEPDGAIADAAREYGVRSTHAIATKMVRDTGRAGPDRP